MNDSTSQSQTQPSENPDSQGTQTWSSEETSWPTIPGYEILGILGTGGMGVVYKARHLAMDRLVALKLIRSERLPNETSRKRFQTEARNIAQLDHPNIVRIWDYQDGEADDCPRIAMEYVAGGNLADTCGKQPWPARKAAALVAQIADAIDYAHKKSIIHLDLKCANILLTRKGTPKITDFGLAKDLMPSSALSTHAGDLRGTPAYMSPEQARGETNTIGPATDIFGLGAILYELLTCRPPLQGQTSDEVLKNARGGHIQPPSHINPKVPKALEKICLKALAPEPEQRFPSAAVLSQALHRFVSWPRRLVIAAASVLGVLLLAAVVSGSFFFNSRDQEPSSPSANPHSPLQEEKELKAELLVRLYPPEDQDAPEDQEDTGKFITDEGVLPARSGQRVLIEARLNQPAYVYLIWLDSQGTPIPLYPWNQERIEVTTIISPPDQEPKQSVSSPTVDLDEGKLKGWKLDKNLGLETILLLARREPLSEGTDLAQLIDQIPPSPLRDPREWGMLVLLRDQGKPEMLKRGQYRGIEKKAEEVDDSVLEVLTRLREHFDVVQAVRFAHAKNDQEEDQNDNRRP